MDFQDHDPDAQALLLVKQFLEEQGYASGDAPFVESTP